MGRVQKKCFNCTYLRLIRGLTEILCVQKGIAFKITGRSRTGAITELDFDEAGNCDYYDGDKLAK